MIVCSSFYVYFFPSLGESMIVCVCEYFSKTKGGFPLIENFPRTRKFSVARNGKFSVVNFDYIFHSWKENFLFFTSFGRVYCLHAFSWLTFFLFCCNWQTHENKEIWLVLKTFLVVSVQNRKKKLNSILLSPEQNRTENFHFTWHVRMLRCFSDPFRSCPRKTFYKWKTAFNLLGFASAENR